VIRKVTRNRKQYPNEESALKFVYMAIREASKKWTLPIPSWREALSADSNGSIHQWCGDCEDLHAHLRYFLQRRSEVDELLHGGGILFEPVNDLRGPTKSCGCFKSHQPVSDLAEHLRRGSGDTRLVPGTPDLIIDGSQV